MFSSKAVEVVDITNNDVTVGIGYKMESEGVPKAQTRPRLGRNGFFCDPRNKDMVIFKAKIKDGIAKVLIFDSEQPVVVNIKFFMRRPNTHFKGRDRLNVLKANLPFAHVAAPDINNLAKFVLDGMNKLVYKDDKQVVKLVVCKLFDSECGCNGRTVVEVTKFDGRAN
ncbi:hypothetical protein ACA910_018787 [Epithemia clementina (nom. ined.)]